MPPSVSHRFAGVAASAGRALRSLGFLATENPILLRDLRVLFRGRRLFVSQFGYLATMSCVMLTPLVSRVLSGAPIRPGSDGLGGCGAEMFLGLFETQVVGLALVAAAYGGAGIALEMEKRTYESLAMSSLSSGQVVFGKIASLSLLCWMLLFTSLPLAFISLMFGGVSPGQVLLSYGLLAAKVGMWASVCVLMSSLGTAQFRAGSPTGNASVLAFLTLVAEGLLLGWLSTGLGSGRPTGPYGVLHPALAPMSVPALWLGKPVPVWLPALLFNGVVGALAGVAAAESLPEYRPRRSAWLRGLLLAFFFLVFLITGLGLSPLAAMATGAMIAWTQVVAYAVGALTVAWLCTLFLIPFVTSHAPPATSTQTSLRRLLAGVRPRRWFHRSPESGVWFTLAVWVTCIAGTGLALLLGLAARATPSGSPASWTGTTLSSYFLVYTASIAAYGLLGAALGSALRKPVISGLLTLTVILATVVPGVLYQSAPGLFPWLPSHPAIILASPPVAGGVLSGFGLPSPGQSQIPLAQAAAYAIGWPIAISILSLVLLWRVKPKASKDAWVREQQAP